MAQEQLDTAFSREHSGATATVMPLHGIDIPRYAIYYAPRRDSAWWMFGCAWLGRDAITDTEVAHPEVALFDAGDIAQMTAIPRRYGFHATLKAPFRLAPGYAERDVYRQAASLAATLKATPLPQLHLSEVDDFVALSFANDADGTPACDAIAAQCVTCFDNLRARPDAAELARRKMATLTPRQTHLLAAWGYPFVFDAFRFHMTLTGPLSRAQRNLVIDALTPLVEQMQAQPLLFDALSIYRQATRDAPFVITRRYAFDGAIEIYRDD